MACGQKKKAPWVLPTAVPVRPVPNLHPAAPAMVSNGWTVVSTGSVRAVSAHWQQLTSLIARWITSLCALLVQQRAAVALCLPVYHFSGVFTSAALFGLLLLNWRESNLRYCQAMPLDPEITREHLAVQDRHDCALVDELADMRRRFGVARPEVSCVLYKSIALLKVLTDQGALLAKPSALPFDLLQELPDHWSDLREE